MEKDKYIVINGKRIYVSSEIYKEYFRSLNREKYLKRVDRENNLTIFSSLPYGEEFEIGLADKSMNIEKIIETKHMIESLRIALSKLNYLERELIKRLYFDEEKISSIANNKGLTHPAIIKQRDKILEKLRKMMK